MLKESKIKLTLFRSLTFFTLLFAGTIVNSFAQTKASIPGDFPDPTVIYADGHYYSIGTSSEWGPHFPIYRSDDLMNWEQTGFLFSETPEWAQSSFWAAEYFYHKGLYYVYYSAKRKSDGVSCIAVATSKYPDRDFVDKGIVVDYGTESIDAFVIEDGGELYMTWKAYGLDKRPIELLGSKLSDDGFRLEGEPFSLLLDTAKIGVEGQSFVKKDGYYYLFYSAGACCGIHCDYHVQAVRSRSIKGPYERVGTPILLGENKDWKCMGHGTFVKGKDQQLYYLFHGYSKRGTTYTGREGLLATLHWDERGNPAFTFVPASVKTVNNKVFDFKSKDRKPSFWQWDFRYASPVFKPGKDGLSLSGTFSADNPTGIAVTWRPSAIAYEIETALDVAKSSDNAEKGLIIYGDKDRSIGLSLSKDELAFWRMVDGKRKLLKSIKLQQSNMKQIELKLALADDLRCSAYWKQGKEWTEIQPDDKALANINGLSPWDRSPRPGLYVKGDPTEQAVFIGASFKQ